MRLSRFCHVSSTDPSPDLPLLCLQMGDIIDNSLGVTFGLSTLTAAGIGQIFSDVSGVCFGGTVEALVSRMGLPTANLSTEQAHMRVSKLYATMGAACGVILGCLLGMTTLLFRLEPLSTLSPARLRGRESLA